jgi:DNA-binding NarL/FixJ family response regulator
LSPREVEVLRLISEGKNNAVIAESLQLSPHTVVRHRQNVMKKLGIHSIAGLTRYAVREKIVAL